MANARYKLGKQEEPRDLQAAAQDMMQSCELYKRAVKLDRSDKDAKFNLELAFRELKKMQEKLKQMPPQEKKQQGQGQDKKQAQPQEQQGSGGQEKQQAQEEEKKKEDEKNAQARQQESHQGKEKKNNEQKPQAAQESKQMMPQEARMLLDGYRQVEAGQGKLHDQDQTKLEEVTKDW